MWTILFTIFASTLALLLYRWSRKEKVLFLCILPNDLPCLFQSVFCVVGNKNWNLFTWILFGYHNESSTRKSSSFVVVHLAGKAAIPFRSECFFITTLLCAPFCCREGITCGRKYKSVSIFENDRFVRWKRKLLKCRLQLESRSLLAISMN